MKAPDRLRPKTSRRVLVIGAGLGGLAAAVRLARAGCTVEVWEKNGGPGGKAGELRAEGFRWGTGPSLLTMPDVLRELFAEAGERMEEHLELVRLDSACRYFWTDGTVIDEDASFWSRPEVGKFLEYARGIYELSGEAYLNRPPGDFWRAFTPGNLGKLRHLGKVATTRTLAAEVERRISDPHVRQIFLRFATYNGSSPYLTPATFNIIPYVEATFGAWYVRGGMGKIGEALAALAERNGVTFRFNTTATGWDGTEATAHDGARSRADFLVCNGDALSARAGFLSGLFSPEARRKALAEPLSTSGFILFLGARGRDERLGHHNIFFSDDYPKEFSEIHGKKIAPREPTIYISVSSRSDPDHAPAGHDNYFVLVNAPARDPKQPWTKGEAEEYRDLVLKRLERFGFGDLRRRIVAERIFTPGDFAARDLAYHGALYGWASHSIRTSLLRPALRAPGAGNVFFAGGTTHPGGGIPLALLSGKMAAELIEREAA
ncbi:MAG TPA: phytoene desaturase family protein [Candidatus Methylacidiphilales bacterium]|jgi:phytoene desaturase|nr:phytoene desaturase family protein [Candidatus Methylacidiphilales bacterium]